MKGKEIRPQPVPRREKSGLDTVKLSIFFVSNLLTMIELTGLFSLKPQSVDNPGV